MRLVTNDSMFTGGDGYTILAAGASVQQPADALLDVVLEFVALAPGVAPVVEGRIIGP